MKNNLRFRFVRYAEKKAKIAGAAARGGGNGATAPPPNFGTPKIYPLFPLKRAILTLLKHETSKFSRVDFFNFSLFYKQNALIYATNFFNATKNVHI